MAGRSDCDDATRSQHEAMTAYARNSSLSRISSASLATASRLAAPRPLSAEAAAARVSTRGARCPRRTLPSAVFNVAAAGHQLARRSLSSPVRPPADLGVGARGPHTQHMHMMGLQI